MRRIKKKNKKIRKATLYNENNELCDYTINMEKLKDATLTDDEKAVLKALLEISEKQEEYKIISVLEARGYKVTKKNDANGR